MGLADRDYMHQTGKNKPANALRPHGKRISRPATFSFLKRIFIFVGIIVVLTWAVDRMGKAPSSAWRSVFSSKVPAIALPETGNTTLYQLGHRSSAVAEFKVIANPSHDGIHHLIKLIEATSDAPVLSLFVRNGETATIKVPLGTYKVKMAQGKQWYGETKLFGRDMLVKQGITLLDFSATQNSVTGHILSLEGAIDGNYPTRPLVADSF